MEKTLRQLLSTSAVTCTIRKRNQSTGLSIHLKSKCYLAKRGILDYFNGGKSRTHGQLHSPHVGPVICNLSMKGSSSCAFCSIFKTRTSAWILTCLDYSTAEVSSSTKPRGLENTDRICTACLLTVWIIHDFWTQSKQTRGSGTSARYRRLLSAEVTGKTSIN